MHQSIIPLYVDLLFPTETKLWLEEREVVFLSISTSPSRRVSYSNKVLFIQRSSTGSLFSIRASLSTMKRRANGGRTSPREKHLM